MDCATYLTQKPNDKWIKLSGCVVSRILSVPKTTVGGSPTEVYVPIHADGAKEQRQIHLLLASDNPGDLEFVKMANQQTSTSSGRGRFRSSYGGQLEESRGIEGRALRGLDLSDRDRAKLTKIFPTLTQDFIIIEPAPRPGFSFPFTFIMLAGIVGGIRFLGAFKLWLTSRFPYLQGDMATASK
jgi:hypothetical protein